MIRHVKLGTQPAAIVLRYKYTLEVGKRVEYRMATHGSEWETAQVERLEPVIFLTKL